jgi:hypothetical protein
VDRFEYLNDFENCCIVSFIFATREKFILCQETGIQRERNKNTS